MAGLDVMRAEAQRALLEGLENGNLERAICAASKVDIQTPETPGTSHMFQKTATCWVADVLDMGMERGSNNSSACDVYAEPESEEEPGVEDLRAMARDILVQAASAGRLAEVLNVQPQGAQQVSGQYYQSHFRAMPQLAFTAQWAKFPERAVPQVTPAPIAKQFSAAYYAQHFAQMPPAAWSSGPLSKFPARANPQKTPAPLAKQFDRSYYTQNFRSLPPVAWNSFWSKFPRCAAATKASDIADVRLKTHETLIGALGDGRLEQVMSDVKREQQERLMRKQMKDCLVQGAKDGSLNASLRQAKEESKALQEEEMLRDQMRKVLVQGAKDGSLQQSLLAAKKSPQPAVHDIAGKVGQVLIEGLNNGTLAQALLEVSQDNAVEEARAKAKAGIMAAVGNGRLDAAIAIAAGGASVSGALPQPSYAPTAPGIPRTNRPRPVAASSATSGALSPSRQYGGGNAFQTILQLVSMRDQRIGELRALINEAEDKIKEKDAETSYMEDQVQLALMDGKHIEVDIEWHKVRVCDADARSDGLTKEKRMLALELDDISRHQRHNAIGGLLPITGGQGMVPPITGALPILESPRMLGGKMAGQYSGRSMASTMTSLPGGNPSGSYFGTNQMGWTTDRTGWSTERTGWVAGTTVPPIS